MQCDRKIGPFDCCSVVQGDCLELMKQLPDGCVDAVITDPPYGTGWVRGGGSTAGEFHARHEKPSWDVFSTSWIRLSLSVQWVVFSPKNRAEELARVFPDAGLAYYRKTNPRPNGCPVEALVISPKPWTWGALERSAYNGDSPFHPCQKPDEIMNWLVSETSGVVLDPFSGSGSTLVAAAKLGRHFLGFEISPEYCEIARKRIAAVEAQPTLFEPKAEQGELGL